MIKDYKFAGTFYPENKTELQNIISSFGHNDFKNYSRAIIVPHAGYIYSGELAAKGFDHLERDIKNIFIFAPAHFEKIFGCVTCNYEGFNTPLGTIKVNSDITKNLIDNFDIAVNNFVFEKEHSIEVLLPFIKEKFSQINIIPVIYGCENFENITKIISQFYDNKENVFIISSDLSHFYPEKEAVKVDLYTAKMIEENNIRNFENEQACGAVGICGLVNFAKERGFSVIRAGLNNSSKTNNNQSSVVGYGAWFLYEGEKNNYIKENYSDFVKQICKNSIMSGLHLGYPDITSYDCVFEQAGASFVTLKLNGDLRGCIGSITAYQSLIKDLQKNAHAAAFFDNRFKPLTLNEFLNIELEISLLSKPERITFEYESDLIEKIIPYRDGIIIRDGIKRAVFLPEVWEQIPDKTKFLKELKIKAGLEKNHFSENFEAFKFTTTKI